MMETFFLTSVTAHRFCPGQNQFLTSLLKVCIDFQYFVFQMSDLFHIFHLCMKILFMKADNMFVVYFID